MKKKYFGTDGIRGTANKFPMTADLALKVGMAAGSYFLNGNHRHKVVIGKDTRLSGYMIEPALTSGFISVGMDVILVGPMPTPAIAMLTRTLRADLGVMISASHNPYYDNGIKLFDRNGMKLSDNVEMEIEKRIAGEIKTQLASPKMLGRAKRLDDAPGRYIEYVKHTFPKRKNLNGIKIVVDCANGASYHLAKNIFWELEADVIAIGDEPNGFNINENCGSTSPAALCEEVRKQKADIGIGLDGDADRVVFCDEKGQVIPGDKVLAVIANHQKELGTLQGEGIVATSMSNMALEKYLNAKGLELVRTEVGDRYVADWMSRHGYNVGGEQSGHIIINDYNTTGDGLIAALQVLAALIKSGKKVSEFFDIFDLYPQSIKNIPYKDASFLTSEEYKNIIKKYEHKINGLGRIIVRKSGTEPLVRVMVEAENENLVKDTLDSVSKDIAKLVG